MGICYGETEASNSSSLQQTLLAHLVPFGFDFISLWHCEGLKHGFVCFGMSWLSSFRMMAFINLCIGSSRIHELSSLNIIQLAHSIIYN